LIIVDYCPRLCLPALVQIKLSQVGTSTNLLYGKTTVSAAIARSKNRAIFSENWL